MQISRIFACPNCHCRSFRETSESITCASCDRSYYVLNGIVDFRDANIDSTANFSISEDRILAEKLIEADSITNTFNEMYEIYKILKDRQKKGEDIKIESIEAIIKDENIRAIPLTPVQLTHGPAILDKIEQYIKTTKHNMPIKDIALENGSGLGFFIDGFSSYFNALIVLDFSLAYLILAKKIIEERRLFNVTLVCGSVERLPIQSDAIDFIHSNNVIEHVANQEAMLTEAKRVLKPGAMLFVLSPNRFSLYFEPHFRLPGYGFFPEPIRRRIIRKMQKRDIDDISLLSLGELRELAVQQFGKDIIITFIPRYLKNTVMGGVVRNVLVKGLNSKIFGEAVNIIVNRIALGLMPYHVMFCFKS